MAHYIRCLAGQNLRNRGHYVRQSIRSASASSSALNNDPGKLVSGLTAEEVDANPEVAEFLRSNFANDTSEDVITSGVKIPTEVLEKFGIETDVVTTPEKKYGDPRVDAGQGNAEQESLNIRVLKTYLRSEEGSRSSRHLRNNSMIPGILFGSDPNSQIRSSDASSKVLLKTPWPELQRELDRYHRRFESRVYDLTVYEDESDTEGTVHRVVPSSVQRHPVQGSIYCANFLRYHAGRPLKIPLEFVNKEESPALKRDGYIIPVRKFVDCFVEEGVAIPDALEVECTGLQLKDVIRIDRLIFPDGVRPIDTLDLSNFVIGPVRGGRGAATAEDGGDGGEAEDE